MWGRRQLSADLPFWLDTGQLVKLILSAAPLTRTALGDGYSLTQNSTSLLLM